MHVYNTMGKKDNIDSLIYGDKSKAWNWSLINELGCLAQGKYFGVKGIYSIDFPPQSEIKQGQDITYVNFFW